MCELQVKKQTNNKIPMAEASGSERSEDEIGSIVAGCKKEKVKR